MAEALDAIVICLSVTEPTLNSVPLCETLFHKARLQSNKVGDSVNSNTNRSSMICE